MSFVVVIPARYQSTRLPGKPLLDIHGKSMLQHTWLKASSSAAEAVYIATDDVRIRDAAQAFGAQVFMTAENHRSGTDRIHEVVRKLGLGRQQVVVNVQGDEPTIPPAVINQVADNLRAHSEADIATLCEPITSESEIDDPAAVKVVFSKAGHALYFSRSRIPCRASTATANYHRHIGIYAYRVPALDDFVSWPEAELEATEKLEQLRALYNDARIHVELAREPVPAGVDTEQDLEAVRSHLGKLMQ